MALPAAFLDELRARTPMAALVGRRVKLARSGKSWKGCCPFHNEKSPSFYVYDDGYHCFGCGAHGDAISFVMNTQGSNFVDAIEALAGEVGLEIPKASPAMVEAERQRLDLTGVLDLALRYFQRLLFERPGAEALAYLRGRGLSDDTIRDFNLGWSGDGRGGLLKALAAYDIDIARAGEAGLLQAREDGGARELFYNRVMFPIRDRRGRVISFGGRGLAEAKPKYINGPESPVYSKRRTLYGLDRAREGARRSPVVVVEGYMDVIALHQAGFAAAVAPLGTALTAPQLEELWRLSDAPCFCFDGDSAGLRAAARAAEAALPLLTPSRTVRLATLPPGEDPDSLIRRGGSGAFETVLQQARPLSVALFDMLRDPAAADTPEARAAFQARLDAAAEQIQDKGLSAEYKRTLRDRVYAERQATRRVPGGRDRGKPFKLPVAHAPILPGNVVAERHRTLLAILLLHPDILSDVAEALASLPLEVGLAGLRQAMLQWWHSAEVLDSGGLLNHLGASGFEEVTAQVLATGSMPLTPAASATAMPAEAEAGWWHFFGLLNYERLLEEIRSAERDLTTGWDAAAQRRLIALCAARSSLFGDAESEDIEAGA
jgi:DNA primase